MKRIADRVAVVTGAGKGIGRATSVRLAGEGAAVVCVDIDAALAAETSSILAQSGATSLPVQADISRGDDRGRIISASVEALGRIDILVNNAGVILLQGLFDTTEADWDAVCDVNAKGTFFVLQAAARQMVQQGGGGKIVNIASISGKQPEYFLHYGVSKAGIISMTKSAAVALGPHGINVNAVCPGETVTDLHLAVFSHHAANHDTPLEEVLEQRDRKLPTGRRSRPEDIAAMIAFLCSGDSDNITGQAINVDGGAVTVA